MSKKLPASSNIIIRFKINLFLLIMCSIPIIANAQIVHTIFGDINEENRMVIAMLNHKALQRLKSVDQSGPLIYFSNLYPKFSRYDHSLGVYALLKRYNVSVEEQIAGLMHDASHTAFSHLSDFIFQPSNKHTESYQDNIHDWYLTEVGVADVIRKYGMSLKDISPKNSKYVALEQEFPDMNADRIEYNLHTGLAFNDINDSDVKNIIDALKFQDGKWYFTDMQYAKKFAKLSTYYTKNFWGGKNSIALYAVTAGALKYALSKNLVSPAELQFGVDQEIINKLSSIPDQYMIEFLDILRNIDSHCVIATSFDYDLNVPVKMRGIDPLVLQHDKIQRLSEISIDFKQDLQQTAAFAKNGVNLKFVDVSPEVLQYICKS